MNKNHQIDLNPGESIRLNGHTLTFVEIDVLTQEVIFELDGPDGSSELIANVMVRSSVAEGMLV